MTKTLGVGFGKDAKKVTLTSTGKKLYGTMIWIDNDTNQYYAVQRSTHLGRTREAASLYSLSKEEFDAI